MISTGVRWVQSGDLELRTVEPLRPPTFESRAPCELTFWMLQTPVNPDGSAATIEEIQTRYRRRNNSPPLPRPRHHNTTRTHVGTDSRSCNDTVTVAADAPLWTPGEGDSFEMRFDVSPD